MNSATLHVMLSRKFGSSVNYDAEKHELSAGCGVEGYVWNTDTKFDAKRCSVSFYRGSTDGLSPFACEHGLREACGSVTLSADLEPEKFIADGHDFSLPPIEIVIVLGDDAYAKTENLVRSCITNGLESSLSLEFSHRNFTERFVTLDDIDVQSKSTYPVIGFNIGRAGQENTFVHCPRYEYDSKTAANLSFVAVGVSIQTSVWNSEFSISEIKLNGQLRCTRFEPPRVCRRLFCLSHAAMADVCLIA
jgi:hypothetical protein